VHPEKFLRIGPDQHLTNAKVMPQNVITCGNKKKSSVHIVGKKPNRYTVCGASYHDIVQYIHRNTTECPDIAVRHGSRVFIIISWNAYCAGVGQLVKLVTSKVSTVTLISDGCHALAGGNKHLSGW